VSYVIVKYKPDIGLLDKSKSFMQLSMQFRKFICILF